MPYRPASACGHPGCSSLATSRGYCEQHKKKDQRPSAYRRGYDADWEQLRREYLDCIPYCERCLRAHLYVLADLVHHRIPVSVRPDLRLVWTNLESLCRSCHEKEHPRGARH